MKWILAFVGAVMTGVALIPVVMGPMVHLVGALGLVGVGVLLVGTARIRSVK